MLTFKKWIENIEEPTIWTVFCWSRHSPGGSYEGVYSTEAEAFVAARKEQTQYENTGVYFKAVKVPERHREELLQYGSVEQAGIKSSEF
jgi:hypothetical protein